ncbi:lytic transglycosylase domain-containing protein [Hugenholtzia roseola]|uniref:lytic transglycosylase domain-containing protein n=1 Tax=Hugenholtzia roseola TaxID=1002 RepID=UPI0004126173|nr:lytic transglycosylase domain-containing protein [Hugenholtzia roseola]
MYDKNNNLRALSPLPLFLLLLLSALLSSSCKAQKVSDIQTVLPVPLPKSLTFAGEPVPLDNPDVAERLERELLHYTYSHATTLLLLKRSGRWRKGIEEILEKKQVPKDFFYLAVAESHLENFAQSGKDAVGMWQFLESTAQSYGLIVNDHIDERQDPFLAAAAAATFLTESKNKLGSWTLAAAGYNRGAFGVERALRMQKEKSYYDLFLNTETGRYIFRILALKIILENPKDYGYCIEKYDYYSPLEYDEISVTQDLESVPDFAHAQGISYNTFRQYNPAISINHNKYDFKLPKGVSSYTFRIPKKK